jgi:3'-phosphoadenosine 5'-phosphosulfate sulfotransferase (PAPS reductase)/FAD synthetase
MAADSKQREGHYLKTGCNNYKKNSSMPIAFWTEKDIWDYIKKYNISYSKIYDSGVSRTGCMFCMFGVHIEKSPNRFELMKKTHPKIYSYCIKKLGIGKVLDYIRVPYGKQMLLTEFEVSQ